ncbi:uncharacterized protein LOC144904812 [Branchiostoma floridae x Branchiostoma belcheri]
MTCLLFLRGTIDLRRNNQIPLHFKVLFSYNTVVMNSDLWGWGSEIRRYIPFTRETDFTMTIRVTSEVFKIEVDGQYYTEYAHRTTIDGVNEVDISSILISHLYIMSSSVGPVGWWPLNEAFGATDVTGNGNDGYASATQLVGGPAGPTSQAFLFGGNTTSYVEIPNNGVLHVRYSYTILAHIYPTGDGGPLFHYGRTHWDVMFWQQAYAPPKLLNRPTNRNACWQCPTAVAAVLTKNSWNYVGATYDHVTGKAAVWHDGAEVGSVNAGSIELLTQREIRVGSRMWTTYGCYSGRMSCLQLYDYVLDENEIAVARRKCEGTCPYGWHPAGYVCYRLFHETVTWETADARCRQEGGRLASVKNEDTHKFLVALKSIEDREIHVWIGLHDCLSCFNLALQKTATSTDSAHRSPGNAVDGNTDGNHHGSTPCFHSMPDISNPSWWVDLGQWYRIDRVVIFNRLDCCSWRINPFNIHIGDSDQVAANPKCGGDHQMAVNQPSISVPCQGMWGRYVGVRLPGSSRTLQLCEVQVFSVPDDPLAEWTWADGTPLSQQDFRGWTPSAPDESYENCVLYYSWRTQSRRDLWEDVECSRTHEFFCERVNPPENLTCSSTTTNSIEVDWLYTELYPYTPLSGYRVWYRHVLDDIYREPTEVTNPPPEATSVVISGLKSGSMYSVSIRALVGTTQSLDVMVQCITETDIPVFLACADATLSSVEVSWISPQALLVGYRANYTLIDQDNPTTITTELGSGNLSHVHQGAVTDREYRFTLVAVGLYKDSLPVDITCATMTPAPEDFAVTSITGTSAKVSWVPSTSSIATGYKVWIRQSGSADIIHIYIPQLSQNEVTFENLIPATEYTISAATINMYVEGMEVNLTVATETHPPLALDVDDKTTDTVVISWLPPRGVIVKYSINYTGNGIMASQEVSGDVNHCELTGLIPGTPYDINLVAVSRFGRSIAVSTNILTDPPLSLEVSGLSATWMVLQWKAHVAEILSFEIKVSNPYDSTGRLFSMNGLQTSYNFTDLLPETEYTIKMTAISEQGRSVEITLSKRTGSISPTYKMYTMTEAYTSTLFVTSSTEPFEDGFLPVQRVTGSPIRTTKETYDEAGTMVTTARTTGNLQGQSTSFTLTTQAATPERLSATFGSIWFSPSC